MPSSTWATANAISSLSVSFGGRPGRNDADRGNRRSAHTVR
jgi:hypothetical protein